MKLIGQLRAREEITADVQRQMYQLMQRHYLNVDLELFEDDLAEKDWVILVRTATDHQLCGFSTQCLLHGVVNDRPIKALFSGDTIIDRAHWGDQALTHVWGNLALDLIDQWSDRCDLYWFLISQGYKTYRFLPVFFHEFYPRYDRSTPRWAAHAIANLAEQKYGGHFDPLAGVVRAGCNQYRLREGVAEVTPERLRDPHVRHFVEKNPRHSAGDELCCIAPLTRDNFTAAAYRVIGPVSATSRHL